MPHMSGKMLVVIAGDCGENAADILVIDDELHDADPMTQSAMNQSDEYNANRMVVLPDRVSFHSCSVNNN